jgi:hypothetical protein
MSLRFLSPEMMRQYSDQAKGWTTGGSITGWSMMRCFLFATESRPTVAPIQPPIQ